MAAFTAALIVCLAATLVAKLAGYACETKTLFAIESPSGHASFSTVFFGCLALLFGAGRPAWQRVAIYVGVAALTVLIAFSRVVVEAHTLPDVEAGLAIGTIAILVFSLFRGPSSPIALSFWAKAVGIPIGAILVASILFELRHWTPEPFIEDTARASLLC